VGRATIITINSPKKKGKETKKKELMIGTIWWKVHGERYTARGTRREAKARVEALLVLSCAHALRLI
jgi:hypothetical protein